LLKNFWFPREPEALDDAAAVVRARQLRIRADLRDGRENAMYAVMASTIDQTS
jgi:hypothetical protein